MKPIPQSALQTLALRYKLSGVVLFVNYEEDPKIQQILSYGSTVQADTNASVFANSLKDVLKWSDNMQEFPPLVKDMMSENLRLKEELVAALTELEKLKDTGVPA